MKIYCELLFLGLNIPNHRIEQKILEHRVPLPHPLLGPGGGGGGRGDLWMDSERMQMSSLSGVLCAGSLASYVLMLMSSKI